MFLYLLLVLLVCTGCDSDEESLGEIIENAGGTYVARDYENFGRSISISNWKLRSSEIQSLIRTRELRSLTFDSCEFPVEASKHLRDIHDLKTLIIRNCTGDLSTLPEVSSLEVTAKTAQPLIRNIPSAVTSLELRGVRLTDLARSQITSSRSLKRLQMSNMSWPDNPVFSVPERVTALNLNYIQGIQLSKLVDLSRIRLLSIDGLELDSGDLHRILSSKSLEALSFRNGKVLGNAGLDDMKWAARLIAIHFDISNSKLNAETQQFLMSRPNISTLSAVGVDLTEVAWQGLATGSSSSLLSISIGEPVVRETIDQYLGMFPHLRYCTIYGAKFDSTDADTRVTYVRDAASEHLWAEPNWK